MLKKISESIRGGFSKGTDIARQIIKEGPKTIGKAVEIAGKVSRISAEAKDKLGKIENIYKGSKDLIGTDKNTELDKKILSGFKQSNQYLENVQRSADTLGNVGKVLLA